ncbi:class I SAM-dependent methyltransferase [Acaryochloris thomasi]|uniref:class I SAM-dependent methyltransferase n=1 Tax=Acaryochloris thomasi TaxID=2929456 RepID=UPI0018F181C9|nr:class I SAM-dependent methyltransferase [Acaryochloris thomasi]
MATVQDHYQNVLSDIYSWMFGGFEAQLPKNRSFFKTHSIHPMGTAVAIDLGSGCGFQSIPLAEKGFAVTAIDLDEHLLAQLKANDTTGRVATVRGDSTWRHA